MARPIIHRLFGPLLRRAEKRLPSLTRLRAAESLPIRLHRRRIYIMPTMFGVMFAIILLVMLLGALNYNNNPALLLTCVLGATCVASMLQTFRSLDQLELHSIQPGTATAGKPLPLRLHWRAGRREHHAISVKIGTRCAFFDAARNTEVDTDIEVETSHRGWMTLPRIQVSTHWPFGWFRAWSWLAPAQRVLVYPSPETGGPAPHPSAGTAEQRRQAHGDEWAGLRDYQDGDPLRHIAWKASARSESLRVKTFDQPLSNHTWHLDWNDIRLADREARIARLARWIIEAHTSGQPWSLSLPGQHLDAAVGPGHYHRCMRALAELP